MNSFKMKKVHPYRYMRPRRIEITPGESLSYGINRHGEDQDIRFGFGLCGKAERENIDVLEIDYAWLGVVFHVVITGEEEGSAFNAIHLAKNDLATVKQLTRDVVLKHLLEHPRKLSHTLETIHEASREQGHLEVIKNTLSGMNSNLDLKEK
ncbi:MAG: hypothetical protein ACI9Y1_002650 [Lentisphaeria bacterium]|jgi:hypothetical protein